MGRHGAIACAVLTAAALAGCAPAPTKGGAISAPGSYVSPNGKYRLAVQVSPERVVSYSIAEILSGRQLARGNAGSADQRWFFVWDSAGNLWVHSNDAGTSVWLNENGDFMRHPLVKGSRYIPLMPREVRDALPSAMRAALEIPAD